jgi:carbon storage regulator CsrA
MLVLSRRKGETVVLDGVGQVSIKVLSGRRVKLAIEAPPGVRVLREELVQRQASLRPR